MEGRQCLCFFSLAQAGEMGLACVDGGSSYLSCFGNILTDNQNNDLLFSRCSFIQ